MPRKIDCAAIPRSVLDVASAIRGAAGRAFLVGGPVRDLMLGKTPSDWDIATDLAPDDVLRIFPCAATVGIEFGRVQVSGIDVVSLRREAGYIDRRHPDAVTFGVPVEEDLRRRDFTINAMAAEFDDFTVIDPFGGADDLGRRVIRAVGDAQKRLAEDPLRILRALRFRTVLGMNLDPEVAALLPELAPLLGGVSAQRVFGELRRILLAPGVYQGILDLQDYGLGQVVLPSVFGAGSSSVEMAARALSMSPPDLVTRLAVLFGAACGAEPARTALAGLNVQVSLKQDVSWVLGNAGQEGPTGRSIESGERDFAYLARRIVDSGSLDQVYRLIDFEQALWRARGNRGFSPVASALVAGLVVAADNLAGPLALTGDDVVKILATSGPAVGEALSYLKDFVMRDPSANVREALESALREWWSRR